MVAKNRSGAAGFRIRLDSSSGSMSPTESKRYRVRFRRSTSTGCCSNWRDSDSTIAGSGPNGLSFTLRSVPAALLLALALLVGGFLLLVSLAMYVLLFGFRLQPSNAPGHSLPRAPAPRKDEPAPSCGNRSQASRPAEL